MFYNAIFSHHCITLQALLSRNDVLCNGINIKFKDSSGTFNLAELLYADDIIFINENVDLEKTQLLKIENDAESGLHLNMKKTKIMFCTKRMKKCWKNHRSILQNDEMETYLQSLQ